ncbi:hypothetical protein ACTNDY_13800 [Tissierellaceae bacterium HCP3S3_D8]
MTAQKGTGGETYNLTDNEIFSELEWNQIIAKLMNWNGEFLITHENNGFELVKAANLDQHLVVDSNKVRKELYVVNVNPKLYIF